LISSNQSHAPVCTRQINASLGELGVALVLPDQALVDIFTSSSTQRVLIAGRAGGQPGQTLEAALSVRAVLMQVEPAVMQALGTLVDVQAAAIEGSFEAAAARRYQLADKGSVCVDASVNHSLKLLIYIYYKEKY